MNRTLITAFIVSMVLALVLSPLLSAQDENMELEVPETITEPAALPSMDEPATLPEAGSEETALPAEEPAMEASPAPEEGGLMVDSSVICRGVVDRDPMGAGTLFPNDVEQLFCHSVILRDEGEDTVIHHVWYWNEQKMADVPLTVRSTRFRTYSSKKILPQWKGAWRVEVTGPDGELLSTNAFNIE